MRIADPNLDWAPELGLAQIGFAYELVCTKVQDFSLSTVHSLKAKQDMYKGLGFRVWLILQTYNC